MYRANEGLVVIKTLIGRCCKIKRSWIVEDWCHILRHEIEKELIHKEAIEMISALTCATWRT